MGAPESPARNPTPARGDRRLSPPAARGIGLTLITQRPAVLNKNVLTQIEVLVCLRMIAPQDRKAIDEWINIHGTLEQRRALMDSLASLDIGTAWFWSPGWLDVFER